MYNFKLIENKWQQKWLLEKTFKTTEDKNKPFFYTLDMFPYPSGAGLHVGHPVGYIATDIIARIKKMQGFNVLHPIGFDAFGLPAEQYAIKTNNHPEKFTLKNISHFKNQLQKLGFAYDWDKEINTSDPDYYKWTQWIFIQLYKKGLARFEKTKVNWCPKLQTVLAKSEIITNDKKQRVSIRGNHPVVEKEMKQWVLKITNYAQQLYDGLDDLNWIESTKKMQKNWIFDEKTKKLLMRDWIFSRQRYWGEPFPIKHVNNGFQLLREQDLPLTLPKLDNFKSQNNKPALFNSREWRENNYDLNTMPTFAGSSWYFIAYILKDENGYLSLSSPEAKAKLKLWLPVDFYVGGSEHTVGHLLYARFWNMVLYDLGISPVKEPFKKLVHQGLVLGEDGKKMSKSKGNVINPDKVIEKYGTDSLRAYIVFMGPFEEKKHWDNKKLKNIKKWLEKLFLILTTKITFETKIDKTKLSIHTIFIKNSQKYYQKLKFNNVISQLMIMLKNYQEWNYKITKKMVKDFLKILNPICPHISEEIWLFYNFEKQISNTPWVKYDEKNIIIKEINYAMLVNGKLKTTIKTKPELSKEEVIKMIENHKKYSLYLKNFKIKKIIFVKQKIINFVGEKND